MAQSMRGSSSIIRKMGMEFTSGPMEIGIRVSGKMVKCLVEANGYQMTRKLKGSGTIISLSARQLSDAEFFMIIKNEGWSAWLMGSPTPVEQ